MLGARPVCAIEFQNQNVCSSLPHSNSIPLLHDVVIHRECIRCFFPVLLGMQRQHWNQCKTSSETTLRASIYWKWCLMRSLFMKNILKPNGKCMENSCNKVLLSTARKMNFDSLLYARNIFSSYFYTNKRLFTNGPYKLRGKSIYVMFLCGPYR